LVVILIERGFGFANLAALRDGRRSGRGEEHTVELIRSVKSGKIKRVYWNKRSITDYFRALSPNGPLDLSWKARSGETLQILRASTTAGYDLFVDGVSFSQLPSLGELAKVVQQSQSNILLPQLEDDRCPENTQEDERAETLWPHDYSVISDLHSDPFEDATKVPETRSSMEMDIQIPTLSIDGPHDELHSELYSPVLEALRIKITSCLPQTEEIVSRAIMNAFFRESSSSASPDSLSLDSADAIDPFQVEVDCLWEATEWVRLNVDYAPRPDTEDLALQFFQKRIDEILCRVRTEELTSDEAAAILLSVAAALGLKFAASLPQKILILDGLERGVTQDDIYARLATFGDVEGAAIAKSSSQFGFCRFYHEESASRVLQHVACTSFPLIGKTKLSVTALQANLDDGLNPRKCLRQVAEPLETLEESLEQDTDDVPPPAPVDTTPHLMGPLFSEESLRQLGSPVCVSQTSLHASFSTNESRKTCC